MDSGLLFVLACGDGEGDFCESPEELLDHDSIALAASFVDPIMCGGTLYTSVSQVNPSLPAHFEVLIGVTSPVAGTSSYANIFGVIRGDEA